MRSAWTVLALLAAPHTFSHAVDTRSNGATEQGESSDDAEKPAGTAVVLANAGFEGVPLEGDYDKSAAWDGWKCKGGCVLAKNGNRPWGSLSSASGSRYAILQFRGASLTQTVAAKKDHSYNLKLVAARRPGYGSQQQLAVRANGKVVWEGNPSLTAFEPLSLTFDSLEAEVVIEMKNTSPKGDQSVFFDNVQLFDLGKSHKAVEEEAEAKAAPEKLVAQKAVEQKAAVVEQEVAMEVANAGFEDGSMSGDYAYRKKVAGWKCKGGCVLAKNGNYPWGGLSSNSGSRYMCLQSRGASMRQKVKAVEGNFYTLKVSVAARPGSQTKQTLAVKANGKVLWEGVPSRTEFQPLSATFKATSPKITIELENMSGPGDQSVFFDDVQLLSLGKHPWTAAKGAIPGLASWTMRESGHECPSGSTVPVTGFVSFEHCSAACDVKGDCNGVVFGINENSCESSHMARCTCALAVGDCSYTRENPDVAVYQLTAGCASVLAPNKYSRTPTEVLKEEQLLPGVSIPWVQKDPSWDANSEWTLSAQAQSLEMTDRKFGLFAGNPPEPILILTVGAGVNQRVTAVGKIPADLQALRRSPVVLKYLGQGVPGTVSLTGIYLAPGDGSKVMASCLTSIVEGPTVGQITRAVGRLINMPGSGKSLARLGTAEVTVGEVSDLSATVYQSLKGETAKRTEYASRVTDQLSGVRDAIGQVSQATKDWHKELDEARDALDVEAIARADAARASSLSLENQIAMLTKALNEEGDVRLQELQQHSASLAASAKSLAAKLTGVDADTKKALTGVVERITDETAALLKRTDIDAVAKGKLLKAATKKNAQELKLLTQVGEAAAAQRERRIHDGNVLMSRLGNTAGTMHEAILQERRARKEAAQHEATRIMKAYKSGKAKLSAAALAAQKEHMSLESHLAARTAEMSHKLADLSSQAQDKIQQLQQAANKGVSAVMRQGELTLKEKQAAIDKIQAEADEVTKGLIRVDRETSKLMDEEERARQLQTITEMNATKAGFDKAHKMMAAERLARETALNATIGKAMKKVDAFVEHVQGDFKVHFETVEDELTAEKLSHAKGTADLTKILDTSRTNFIKRLGDVSEETKNKVDAMMASSNRKIAKIMKDDTLTLEQQQQQITNVASQNAETVNAIAAESALIDTEVHERTMGVSLVNKDTHSAVAGLLHVLRAEAKSREHVRGQLEKKLMSAHEKIASELSAEELASAARSGKLRVTIEASYSKLFTDVRGFDVQDELDTIATKAATRVADVMANNKLSVTEKQIELDGIHAETREALRTAALQTSMVAKEGDEREAEESAWESTLMQDTGAFDASVMKEATEKNASLTSLADSLDADSSAMAASLTVENLAAAAAGGSLSAALKASSAKYLARIGTVSEAAQHEAEDVLRESQGRIADVIAQSNLDDAAKQKQIDAIHAETTDQLRKTLQQRAAVNSAVAKEHKARKAAEEHLKASLEAMVSDIQRGINAEKNALKESVDSVDTSVDPQSKQLVEQTEGNLTVRFKQLQAAVLKEAREDNARHAALHADVKGANEEFAGSLTQTKTSMQMATGAAVDKDRASLGEAEQLTREMSMEIDDKLGADRMAAGANAEALAAAREELEELAKKREGDDASFEAGTQASLASFAASLSRDKASTHMLTLAVSKELANKFESATKTFDARHYLAMAKLKMSVKDFFKDGEAMSANLKKVREQVLADVTRAGEQDAALMEQSRRAVAKQAAEVEGAAESAAAKIVQLKADGSIEEGKTKAEENTANVEVAEEQAQIDSAGNTITGRIAEGVTQEKSVRTEVDVAISGFRDATSVATLLDKENVGELEAHLKAQRKSFSSHISLAEEDTKTAMESIMANSHGKMAAVARSTELSMEEKQQQIGALQDQLEASLQAQAELQVRQQALNAGTHKDSEKLTALDKDLAKEALLRRNGIASLGRDMSEHLHDFVRQEEATLLAEANSNTTVHLQKLAAVEAQVEAGMRMAASVSDDVKTGSQKVMSTNEDLTAKVVAARQQLQAYQATSIAFCAIAVLTALAAVGYFAYKRTTG